MPSFIICVWCWRMVHNVSTCWTIDNSYWQILENSSSVSNFQFMSWTDFWKIHPSIFASTYSGFVKYQGMGSTDFWKTRLYLDEFSRNRSSSYPGNLSTRVKITLIVDRHKKIKFSKIKWGASSRRRPTKKI